MRRKRSDNRIMYACMLVGSVIGVLSLNALAADSSGVGVAAISDNLVNSFKAITKLMTGGAYMAGFGLTMFSILKFKQHKDNPQQVPMGTPIVLLLVGVCLIFLPSLINPAGQSIFGGEAKTSGMQGEGMSSFIEGSK